MSYRDPEAPIPSQQQQQQFPQQEFSQQQLPQQPALYAPQYAPYGAPVQQRANVLGIVALALVALPALLNVLIPLIYRQAVLAEQMSFAAFMLPTAQLLVMITALGLSIGGVLQRRAPRFRWAAIGALVCASLSIVSIIGSLAGSWMASVIPY
ncbi:hypothetical protein [Leucobacter sp. wl10]|uniref:hypothetical protein n=1 Tax=Leucobacter sp. wl10 TaxID=2304677 RepID=UPI000E5A49AF|nr:hypothetical protein [Leucobacter sp. wl10]RGE23636.1 hypothetical protein D1J51_01290 [Leucobacter sp. wl10]